MNIRLTQIDGKLPNLALMKLSHWHKERGDSVYFTRHITKDMFESEYDIVYGSAIFTFSQKHIDRFMVNFPNAILGGTGTWNKNLPETSFMADIGKTVESEIIGGEYEHYDYSIYPDYQWSIGFSARGCRLRCGFCVVPQKEGKPRSVNSIYDIWRDGTDKNICLLDNDFFGQGETLQKRIDEILEGGFKVCFNQGINVRLIDDNAAYWLARIPYYDDQFKTRRLYTAWDNFKDEEIFFKGVNKLEDAGVNPTHLMVYMLIGYDPQETWERIFHRFNKMVERGIRPYPMVYNNGNKELKRFQRWVIRRYYEFIKWEDYQRVIEEDINSLPLFSGLTTASSGRWMKAPLFKSVYLVSILEGMSSLAPLMQTVMPRFANERSPHD